MQSCCLDSVGSPFRLWFAVFFRKPEVLISFCNGVMHKCMGVVPWGGLGLPRECLEARQYAVKGHIRASNLGKNVNPWGKAVEGPL